MVAKWPPERVAHVTQVPQEHLQAAAAILGGASSIVSTVLQGVYQSNQATAAAIQVNNLHLIRGMIGKSGSTVFQMNGQPTAQNTRGCGANGELVAFRNWQNANHVADFARVLNVEAASIPAWSPPTPAMRIFRYAETGSIRFLWIIGTNPAVSLPGLHRIRRILDRHSLFLVVQDACPTETTPYADVVLPAALWAEKTVASRMRTAPSTSRVRRSIRPGTRGPISTSFSTTRGGWAFGISLGTRSSSDTTPKGRSMPGENAPGAGRATIRA
jgi:anaerobic selenocysteine-containing dehydrogenase